MSKIDADDFRAVELGIVALATCLTTIITGWSKHAQRIRDERKAEVDKAVAAEVQKVKTTLMESTTKSTDALCAVQDEVHTAHGTIDKVHTIVNSEKTAAMAELRVSRLLTLTALKALLTTDPKNEDLKQAVAVAQTLYDKATKDSADKMSADDSASNK